MSGESLKSGSKNNEVKTETLLYDISCQVKLAEILFSNNKIQKIEKDNK